MASVVDICNMALSNLGERANITSISPPDGSVNADHCARFYPQARDETIEGAEWAFATKRASLAPVTPTIAAYEFAYALPSDYVAASRILQPDSPDEHPGHYYLIEDGVLHCNVEEAVLRYRYVPSVSKFTPHFIAAVSYRLSALLAGPITKSLKTVTGMNQIYLQLLGRAATVDAKSSRNLPNQNGAWRPSWVQARRR